MKDLVYAVGDNDKIQFWGEDGEEEILNPKMIEISDAEVKEKMGAENLQMNVKSVVYIQQD